jgi:hypothetical protein
MAMFDLETHPADRTACILLHPAAPGVRRASHGLTRRVEAATTGSGRAGGVRAVHARA